MVKVIISIGAVLAAVILILSGIGMLAFKTAVNSIFGK